MKIVPLMVMVIISSHLIAIFTIASVANGALQNG
jgi:hypothetical protein